MEIPEQGMSEVTANSGKRSLIEMLILTAYQIQIQSIAK
jgi:hypothetical protein